jgi:hypothetical protein
MSVSSQFSNPVGGLPVAIAPSAPLPPHRRPPAEPWLDDQPHKQARTASPVAERLRHDPDGLPVIAIGTGTWFAVAVAERLGSYWFKWNREADRWEEGLPANPAIGRRESWSPAHPDDLLVIAAEAALVLDDQLAGDIVQLEKQREAIQDDPLRRNSRFARDWLPRAAADLRHLWAARNWLARQQTTRGLAMAVRLARLHPVPTLGERRPAR